LEQRTINTLFERAIDNFEKAAAMIPTNPAFFKAAGEAYVEVAMKKVSEKASNLST
jgi:hypothetical protein